MPTLTESINADRSAFTPVSNPNPSITLSTGSPSGSASPGQSAFTRCPLPILSSSTPDALRTFYSGSQVPQNRLLNPSPNPSGGTTTNVTQVTNNNTTVASNPTNGWTSGQNSNGFWEKNPIGNIRQWGITPTPTSSGTQGTINFPIPFTSQVEGIQMTTEQVSGQHTSIPSPQQGTITLTDFVWQNGTGTDTDGLCPAFWEAIGV